MHFLAVQSQSEDQYVDGTEESCTRRSRIEDTGDSQRRSRVEESFSARRSRVEDSEEDIFMADPVDRSSDTVFDRVLHEAGITLTKDDMPHLVGDSGYFFTF